MGPGQKPIYSGSTSQRRLPVNLEPRDAWLFEPELSYDSPDVLLKTLDGVSVLPTGLLFQGLHALDAGLSPNDRAKLRSPIRAARLNLTWAYERAKAASIVGYTLFEDPIYWITDTWSYNYFHWLCDAIPRLYAAWRQDSGLELLLPGHFASKSFAAESLEVFRLRSVRYVPANGIAICRKFMLTSPAAIAGSYNDKLMGELRRLYRDHFVSGGRTKRRRRIFISRALAARRRIVNEAELYPVLETHGYEVVNTEKMAFSEQVRLLAETDSLAAMHGAGMANMLFMESGGSVVELRNTRNNSFFALATASGQRYAYIQCKAADETQPQDPDVYCSPTELDRLLRRLSAASP